MIATLYDSCGKRIRSVMFRMSMSAFDGFCENELRHTPKADIVILWKGNEPLTTYRKWVPIGAPA